jgi:hypothetical protein
MKRPDAKPVTISLRIQADVAEKLHAGASSSGSSVSELIGDSIAKALATASTKKSIPGLMIVSASGAAPDTAPTHNSHIARGIAAVKASGNRTPTGSLSPP